MSSGFGGGGAGQIRYVITVDDAQAIQKLQGVTQQTEQMTGAVENSSKAVQESEQSNQSFGSSVAQVGTAVAFAASSVINLVQQYTSLKRAQNTLERAQNVERGQVLAITKQRDKYNAAVKEHGKNSKEARTELDKLNLLEAKHQTQLEKVGLQQESLNQRMMSFALSVVPTVIGVVSGLAQTFQILGVGRTGSGGIKGALGMIGRFALPLAAIGAVAIAIKFNLFGLRDAFEGIGVAIGNAIPTLKPFLNAVRDLGVVIGLVPGNAKEAQDRLKKFGGGVIEWGKSVAGAVQKIFDKLRSGDITGAIDDIKAGLKTAFDVTVGAILFDGKPISKWIDQLITFWQVAAKQSGPWQATIDTANIIFKTFVWPNFTDEAKKGLAQFQKNIQDVFNNPAGVGLGGIVIQIDKLFGKLNAENMNTPFANWLSTQIGLLKVTWKTFVSDVNNFLRTVPIIKDIVAFLFPTGDITGGADLNGLFATKIEDPIRQAWANTVDTVYKFFVQNPIIKTISDFIFGTGSSVQTGDITKWLADNIATPLGKAWGNLVNTVSSFLSSNPIIKKITDFIFAAGSSISESSIFKWFSSNILSPVQQGWAKLVNQVYNYLTQNPLIKSITNLIFAPGSSLKITDISKWLTDNILTPIQNAWNSFKNTLASNPAVQAIVNFFKDPIKAIQDLFKGQTVEGATAGTNEIKTILTVNNKKAISAVDVVAKRIASLSGIHAVISLANKTAIKATDVIAKRIDSLTSLKPSISLQNKKAISANDVVAKRIDSLTKIKPSISLSNSKAIKAVDVVAKRIQSLSNIHPSITVHVGASGPGLRFAQSGMHETLAQDTVIMAHKGERVDIGKQGDTRFGGNHGSSPSYQTIMLHISGNDIINERTLSKRIAMGVGKDRDRFG